MDLSDMYFDFANSRDIFYFKNSAISSDEPHYYVCITKTDGGVILLTICTSQEDTIKKYVRFNPLVDESTIVWIQKDSDEEHPFTKDTFINCNNVFEFTKEEFNLLKSENKIKNKGALSEGKFQEMLDGIHSSNILTGEQKALIPVSIDELQPRP